MQLYEKVTTPGGKVKYLPHTSGITDADRIDNMTEGQLVTLGVSAGVTCLLIMEKYIPEHKRNARQIKKLEEAILELAKGKGEELDNDIMEYWAESWNQSMRIMQAGEA